MKNSEFSEKIFEIFVDHIFLSSGLDIYVPSQRKESYLGFDALFQKGKRRIAFFQYKVVNKYKASPSCFAGSTDVYMFNLHKDAHGKYTQHNLLVEKTLKKFTCGYLVPLFVEYKQLYQYFNSGNLLSKVMLLVPKTKISDTSRHHISFDYNKALQFSNNPTCLKSFSLSKFIEIVKTQKTMYGKESFINEFGEDFDLPKNDNIPLRLEKEIIYILRKRRLILIAY